MKKNTKNLFISVLPIALLLVSCTGADTKVSPTHQRKFRDEEEKNTLRDVIRYGEKQGNPAPSTGNTRVFVVPVEFKDYPASEIGKYYNCDLSESSPRYAVRHTESTANGRGAEQALEDIRKVFFGNPEDTCWHSLASYYKESSYNQLRFNGIVAPWYRPALDFERPDETWATARQWASTSDYAASMLATEVIDYYSNETFKHYKNLTKEDGTAFTSGTDFLQYFDSDDDGFFDLIEIVYSAPYYATDVDGGVYKKPINNDIFWAYCGGLSGKDDGNVTRPTVNKYAFFSYYTFLEAGKLIIDGEQEKQKNWTTDEICEGIALMDAHTLIHETGHAIGLPDYYDTDYSGKNLAGSIDMMDHNVGDHNSYSKTQLGWVDPIVVTGPTQVSIKSFTETGECIMVPYRGFYKDHPDYGNSTMIEYLAIELYTPTGVNKADSEHNYAGNYPKCPSIPGVKIYHIDSRLGTFTYGGGRGKFNEFTEKIVGTGSNGFVRIASSNSGSDHVEDFWQLQFMPRSSETMITLVSNDNLFQAGDKFNDNENYSHFVMNERTKEKEEEIPFGYKITIKECSANGATILFEAC